MEDIHNKPWLADAKAYYEDKRVQIATKYPAWWESRTESINNNIADETARNLMVDRYAASVRANQEPAMDDAMVAQFEAMLTEIKERLRLTAGIDSLEDAPPQVHGDVIKLAIENARINPRWRSLWGQYYEKTFGPITSEMRL